MHLKGAIILDNADWYPRTAAMLRSADFKQIDFCGFGPFNAFNAATSIFFRPQCRLFDQKRHSELTVIGGNEIKGGVLDDHP